MTEMPVVRSRVNRIAGALAWAEALLLIGWLAFAYALPEDLRNTRHAYAVAAVIAFFGRTFTFHIGLLLGFLAILTAAAKLRRLALFTAVVSLLCIAPAVWSLRPRHVPLTTSPAIRLMSMNVKYEDINFTATLAQIREQNPDVIAVEDLTEVAFDTLQKALAPWYPHRSMRGGALAIYSRLPFVDQPQATVDHLHRQLRVVIEVNGWPMAIYVVHTYSPRSVNRIIRTREATADLLDDVQGETLPTVLIGDFNFTTESANGFAMKDAGFIDAFESIGRGRGSTWPVRPTWLAWLPGVRIDHAYLSPSLVCSSFRVGQYIGSDHLPIGCDVGFAK